jgi:hypothetical protein
LDDYDSEDVDDFYHLSIGYCLWNDAVRLYLSDDFYLSFERQF